MSPPSILSLPRKSVIARSTRTTASEARVTPRATATSTSTPSFTHHEINAPPPPSNHTAACSATHLTPATERAPPHPHPPSLQCSSTRSREIAALPTWSRATAPASGDGTHMPPAAIAYIPALLTHARARTHARALMQTHARARAHTHTCVRARPSTHTNTPRDRERETRARTGNHAADSSAALAAHPASSLSLYLAIASSSAGAQRPPRRRARQSSWCVGWG